MYKLINRIFSTKKPDVFFFFSMSFLQKIWQEIGINKYYEINKKRKEKKDWIKYF